MREEENKRWRWGAAAYWFCALLPLLASALLYRQMPEEMVTQWAWDGTPGGYSSREMACFGIPGFLLLMVVLVNGAFRLDPKWKNIRESKTMYVLSRWFVVILAIVVQGIILANAMGVLLDVARAISVFLAMFFFFLGLYLPECRSNYTMGIRIPWTLHDEENWRLTHRFAGRLWTAGGAVMAAAGFFKWMAVYFGVLAVMTVGPMVYSYWVYRRKGR